MSYTSDAEVEHLVTEWRTHRLPRPEWTHAAHLTVAVWHLKHFTFESAEHRVREGIKAYNAAMGIPTTPTGGYHETVTLFYLKVIGDFLATLEPNLPLHAAANAVIAAFGDRAYALRFYSKERLMSPEARTAWVEPDLLPLQR